MELMKRFLLVGFVLASACSDSSPSAPTAQPMSFFVTSQTIDHGQPRRPGGCRRHLSAIVGVGRRRQSILARVSERRARRVQQQSTDQRTRSHRRGSWHNATGALVANSLAELHGRTGDASLFVDERGQRINGQWTGSPAPVQHDIMTGSNADGTLMRGLTCSDWTSGLGVRRRTGRSFRRHGTRTEHGGCAWPPGTPRTQIRTAPIPHLVAGPAASIASRGRRAGPARNDSASMRRSRRSRS